MTTAFLVLALALSLLGILKTQRLSREVETIHQNVRDLEDMYKASRLNLRRKLNRLIRFQKQAAGEDIPTLLFKKQDKKVEILFPYESIYSIAQDEGFGLTGTCEGNGDCGLCVIAIHSGAESLTPMNKEEKDILEKLGHPEGTRLSCQSRPKGDVTVDFIEY